MQFMAANCGKSTTREAEVADDAEAVPEEEAEAGCGGDAQIVHDLLDEMAKRQQHSDTQDAENGEGRTKGFLQNVATATQIGVDLWGLQNV